MQRSDSQSAYVREGWNGVGSNSENVRDALLPQPCLVPRTVVIACGSESVCTCTCTCICNCNGSCA
jgi:hypothetical protein